MTSKQIRLQIREHKAMMKQAGIRKISCFNGGLSSQEYHANARLFALKCELEQAIKHESTEVNR